MVTKLTKEYTDAKGPRKLKKNMDIEFTVHTMTMADQLVLIVLLSGDGDYRVLIEALQLKGKRVSVV